MIDKQQLQEWIGEYLKGTDYELITLEVSAGNDILVEVDRLAGVDVDFCAELNRYLVEKIEDRYADRTQTANADRAQTEFDYSLEVGSVSLTDPFKTKMQFEKNLGHDVEVAFSNRCAMVHTAPLNEQATDASALPTNVRFAGTPLNKGEKLIKYHGQLVSVDEETFSVDCEEKAPLDPPVEGGRKPKRPKKQIVTHTWRYDEPKYVRYDLKF